MNPATAEEISLYELAISTLQPPVPLQISLPTFKSIVTATLELLTEQNLPATILLKLPDTREWQDSIAASQLNTNQQIYIFFQPPIDTEKENNQENSEPENSPPHQPQGSQQLIENKNHLPSSTIFPEEIERNQEEKISKISPIFSFRLEAKEKLKQEYFLLVLSHKLCCGIIAHRPRSVDIPIETGEEKRERPLLTLCLVNKPTIVRVLEGLKKAIASNRNRNKTTIQQPEKPRELSPVTTEELLAKWHKQISNYLTTDTEIEETAHWISLLWAKQIQQQEETWRKAQHYRQKAAAAEKLQAQNEKLVEALHQKDEIICNAMQALRMPLTNMKTALSLLDVQNLKAAQRAHYLQLLKTECEQQTTLINGILELVQLDSISETAIQPLHLADIVPAIISTYQPLAQEKGIMLAYTLPDNLPPVACYRPWLKQIVINLLHNSIKFTKSGGQVWVRGKQQGDYVQLEFRDTGIGIPASEIPKIFERFYRGRHNPEEETSGAGLGLSIVQQLLLRCGGSISVQSQLGKGSTFKVLLPIYHKNLGE